MSFKKILVGLDFSPLSQQVFREALDLACLNNSELFLLHCISADSLMLPPPFSGELGLTPHLMNQTYQMQSLRIDDHTRQAMVYFEQYCQQAEKKNVKVNFEYQVVEAGFGLCRKAQEWGADLIFVGRRGRQGLSEMFLGSVSNYVLHHSPCAVLVVQGEASQPRSSEAEASEVKYSGVEIG